MTANTSSAPRYWILQAAYLRSKSSDRARCFNLRAHSFVHWLSLSLSICHVSATRKNIFLLKRQLWPRQGKLCFCRGAPIIRSLGPLARSETFNLPPPPPPRIELELVCWRWFLPKKPLYSFLTSPLLLLLANLESGKTRTTTNLVSLTDWLACERMQIWAGNFPIAKLENGNSSTIIVKCELSNLSPPERLPFIESHRIQIERKRLTQPLSTSAAAKGKARAKVAAAATATIVNQTNRALAQPSNFITITITISITIAFAIIICCLLFALPNSVYISPLVYFTFRFQFRIF